MIQTSPDFPIPSPKPTIVFNRWHLCCIYLLFTLCPVILLAQDRGNYRAADEQLQQRQEFARNSLGRIIENLGLPHLPPLPTSVVPDARRADPNTNSARIRDDYILQPGDQIGIAISGKEEKYFTVNIFPDGQIYLPQIGFLPLSGKNLTNARREIDAMVRQRFTNFTLNISVVSTRPMRVHVTGQVLQPGEYFCPPGASVLEVLQMSGGFLPDANIRDIELLFQDGRAKVVDLYDDFFGRTTPGHFLSADARIKIRKQINWFALDGAIPRPGLFQLSKNKMQSLFEALTWAGIDSEDLHFESVRVNRLEKKRRKLIFVAKGDWQNFYLKNGDIVYCNKLTASEKKSVTISGEIRRPGTYRWAFGMRLSDVLNMAGGLTENSDSTHCDISAADDSLNFTRILANPSRALRQPHGATDPVIAGESTIFIPQNPLLQQRGVVTVRGEFLFPGRYPITKNKTKLAQILERAGGFNDFAQKRGLRILRKFPTQYSVADAKRFDRISANQLSRSEYEHLLLADDLRQLGQVTLSGTQLFETIAADENPILRDGDIVFVPAKTDLVYIAGRVGKPAGIKFTKGLNFDDYIEKAGGFAWDANKHDTKIIRVSGEIVSAKNNTPVSPGDIIWVPVSRSNSKWQVFRDLLTVATQLATIFLIIDRTRTE